MLRLLRTNLPVFDMLKMEEAIFRTKNSGNWIIFNNLSDTKPSVVCGLGQNKIISELINVEAAKWHNIPVIRRFTGGGSVLTDHNTFFISFIFDKSFIEDYEKAKFNVYPREIMTWSEEFYKQYLKTITPTAEKLKFKLEDTDYVFGSKKFGGNAQGISGDRFVHHTSFLHDFDSKLMENVLLNPKKQPEYRKLRRHDDFLISLSKAIPEVKSIDSYFDALDLTICSKFASFGVNKNIEENLNLANRLVLSEHRKKTEILF